MSLSICFGRRLGLRMTAVAKFNSGLAVVLLALGMVYAQTPTAKITGTVRDAGGSIIPNVTVTVVNIEAGVRTETKTNESGLYSIPFLNPGRYELTVEWSGFKKYVRQNLVLETGQVATLDIQLELGQVAEVVNVTSAAPLLESATSSVSQLIENKTIINMPLASRRAAALIRLMGNVTFIQESGGGENLPIFSLAGGRARNQMWYIDGAVGQNSATGTPQLILNPPVEALQEIKIEANNYSAEYGRSTGGFFTMTTKSGTNRFHGTAYEYLRNDALDARRFFSPGVSPRKYNVFGGAVGGPIKKDRTHFFVFYEGARRRDGVTRVLNVPAPAEIRGDFSSRSGQLLDPSARTPFPNNIIPASRLDPVGRQLAAFYAAPNVPGRPSGSNNFAANTVNTVTQDAVVGRIDHQFAANDRIYARHIYTRGPVNNGPVFSNTAADPFAGTQNNRIHFLAASWQRTFNPRLVNEFRFTYSSRVFENFAAGSNGSNVVKQIGLRGVPEDGMPRVNVAGLSSLGGSQHQRLERPILTNQFIDAVSWFPGRHAIKFGFEFRRSGNSEDNDGLKYGALNFNDVATGRGFALAALLLGWVQAANVQDADLLQPRVMYLAGYVQDDWKITPRLTLNLGVRWDLDSPRWEAIDNRQSGFDPFAINPVSGTPGIVTSAGRDGRSRYAHDFDKNNFGPRFGFAWRPVGDKTVLRGGFGVMYAGTYDKSVNFVGAVGFGDTRAFSSPDNGLTPAFLLRDGIPETAREKLGPGFGAVKVGDRVTVAPDFFARDHQNPYAMMFNFGVQRELRGNILLEALYLANLGHKLGGRDININEIRPELRGARADQRLRPFPQFGNVTWNSPGWGNSSYHSVNLKMEKRFSHGLNFLANYTWSKFIDDVEANNELGGAPGTSGLQGGGHQSYYSRRLDKALSGNDIPHRFIWSSVYELPVGKGKRAAFSSGILNQVLGGWSVGLIAEFRNGPPFGVVEQTNRLNAFSPSQRPNLLGDPKLPSNRPRRDLVDRWFNTDAFVFPGDGVLGTAGRSVGRGPGLAQFEMSLLKDWPMGEQKSLQLRGEFFNLFNRPNFDLPNNQRGSAAFGRISGTFGDGRIIQLGLKFTY